jgi:hypothetical protein
MFSFLLAIDAISSGSDASGCTDFGVLSLDVDKQEATVTMVATRRPFQEEAFVFSLLLADEVYTSACAASLASRWGTWIHLEVDVWSRALFRKVLVVALLVVRFTYNGLGTMHTEHDELHNTQEHGVSKDRVVIINHHPVQEQRRTCWRG